MAHLPDFISDLAIILITAGIVTIIFKWLKQPIVLGYIVAGFLASPHLKELLKGLFSSNSFFDYLPQISDTANVNTWAEIGVIFLLFALGLEFSFKKLMDVGGTASIATLINMGSMIIIGYTLGHILGWSQMDSIFLGGMLSMSSTTIIIKAFNDMGLQKKKFASIVFGMLIVEDLAAILMMVLLTTVAVSRHFEGTELVNSILKLLFFMIIWFVVGIYLIPTLLKKFKKYLNDETLLIVSIGMCLGMVLFASYVGFSAALGAFIMGSILAETIEAKHIEHLIEPLKNLFGAVFFVSVGMMIDPIIIYEYAGLILLFTLAVLIGRIIFATIGVLASGQGLKVAIQSGLSLAQIGEFSFIIANLGMGLGVISDTLYPIIVAVSVITTFTTPYCIKLSGPIYNFVDKHLPQKWEKLRTGYASSNYRSANKADDWKILNKKIFTNLIVYLMLILAVLLLMRNYVSPLIVEGIHGIWGKILAIFITVVLMSPFMRSLMTKGSKSIEVENIWNRNNRFDRGGIITLFVLRVALCIFLTILVILPMFPNNEIICTLVSIAIVVLIMLAPGITKQSRRIEEQFLENLNSKQKYDEQRTAILPTVAEDLLNRDIHIEEFEIPQSSPSIGKTLQELNFRQKTGVNIVCIIRGNKKINIPDANERIYPFDKIVVAGSDDQLAQLDSYLNNKNDEETPTQYHIELSQYMVEENSPMIGKSLKELNIREKTESMIIGIDREGESITNFTPDFVFEYGDLLWIAGEEEKLDSFEESMAK